MRSRASLRSASARALASSSRFTVWVSPESGVNRLRLMESARRRLSRPWRPAHRSHAWCRWLPFPGRARVHAQSTQETGSSSHRGWQVNKFQTWRDRHPGEASNQRRAARPNTGPILAVTRPVTLLRPARGPPHSRWVMRHLEQIGEGDNNHQLPGRGLFTGAGPWQAWNLADPVATGCRRRPPRWIGATNPVG